MADTAKKKTVSFPDFLPFDESHYRELRRKQLLRLIFTYLGPVILLATYFFLQYDAITDESQRLHLQAVAESQASTLDLFLSERIVNLKNLVDDPRLPIPPSSQDLEKELAKLRQASDAFVDIGYFDSLGVQVAYAGPYPSLEKQSYRSESWYQLLLTREANFLITDIYLGFRQRPHFTIAVRRELGNHTVAFRATLDPNRIYEYIRTLEGAGEVSTIIVNEAGQFQLVAPNLGNPLDSSSFIPPAAPRRGLDRAVIGREKVTYAYAWLRTADWSLIVRQSNQEGAGFFSGLRTRIFVVGIVMIIIGLVIVVFRARKLVEMQMESDRTRAQLTHAAKLASVGELAAGIAHEINNPLAAINEEAGLMKDLMDPQFGGSANCTELIPHLESIQQLVFRCRDVTHKLLGFVRKHEIELKHHDVHELLDTVIDGILGHEMSLSRVTVERKYGKNVPRFLTDGNQLQQVFLNLIKNGWDAIGNDQGIITVVTEKRHHELEITVSDTGCGMTADQMDRIFVPFYTTKEVGKGTGLGLSVSYGIIKSLGGEIRVKSSPGRGTSFTVTLPMRGERSAKQED